MGCGKNRSFEVISDQLSKLRKSDRDEDNCKLLDTHNCAANTMLYICPHVWTLTGGSKVSSLDYRTTVHGAPRMQSGTKE